MATTNDFEAVIPRLLTQGLMALRSTCVMPRLVNRDYDKIAAKQGATVDVPLPSNIAVQNVAPATIPQDSRASQPTFVPIPLSEWKEAPFFLSDKDMKEAMDGTIPMQASSAISNIADEVDKYILSQYKGVYNYVTEENLYPEDHSVESERGTQKPEILIPFSGGKTTLANKASQILNENRTPKFERRAVINPAAQAAALDIRAFQDLSWSGENYGIKDGDLMNKLGFDWFMDQNITRHETSGSNLVATVSDGWQINGITTNTVNTVGTSTLAVEKVGTQSLQTTAPKEGDVFTIAGQDQTYVVTADASNDAAMTTWSISPPLKAAVADNAAITFKRDHDVNLAFQRDAIAFVTRPLEDTGVGLGNMMQSLVDPVSGLSLRLEVSREHKRTRFSYDILYGAALIRPECVTRIAG